MKKIHIPILNNEHGVNICVGKEKELIAEIQRYCDYTEQEAIDCLEGIRGVSIDKLKEGTVIGFEDWYHGKRTIKEVINQNPETGEVRFKAKTIMKNFLPTV